MDILAYPLAFLALLGVLVTFHEFGHYIVARWSGVQVLRFSIGFGRPIVRWVDKLGTEFVLALIPFGGFVRMLDDRDPDQRDLARPGAKSYMDLHPRWRVAIALGGPLANFLLAILVFAILLIAGSYRPVPMTDVPGADSPLAIAGLNQPAQILQIDGKPVKGWQDVGLALTNRLGETGNIVTQVRELQSAQVRELLVPINAWHQGVGEPDVIGSLGFVPELFAVVGEVVPDSPAAQGGLKPGDWITHANEAEIATWRELVTAIESHAEQRLLLRVVRSGTVLDLTVVPQLVTSEAGQKGRLGIGYAQILVRSGWLDALPGGVAETWEKTVLIGSIVRKMVTGDVSVKNLSGPLSIAQVAGDSAKYGWRQFFSIMAFLSISLGILNLLPVPILDGGHVVFNSYEWLTGREVPERVQLWGVQVGLVLVGCMFILATYNDVLRLF